MKISHTDNSVTIGNKTFTKFENFSSYFQLATSLGYVGEPGLKTADLNKSLTNFFECTPSKFLNLVNKVFYKVFISKYPERLVKDYLYVRKYNAKGQAKFKISTEKLKQFEQNWPLVEQALKDNQENMIPFILKYSSPPSQLRASFGKGLWKTLCKNTKTRNKLIAAYYLRHCLKKDLLGIIAKTPSSILKHGVYAQSLGDPLFFIYAKKYLKGSWTNPKKLREVSHIFYDTRRLASRLGLPFHMNRLPHNLKEYHDYLVKRLAANEYSSEIFDWLTDFPTFTDDAYTAVILPSPAAIAEEGQLMKHCCAAYASSVKSKEYLILSLRDMNGERHSTLGLTYSEGKFLKHQHYMKYNAPVNEESVISFANYIIKEVNKIHNFRTN